MGCLAASSLRRALVVVTPPSALPAVMVIVCTPAVLQTKVVASLIGSQATEVAAPSAKYLLNNRTYAVDAEAP